MPNGNRIRRVFHTPPGPKGKDNWRCVSTACGKVQKWDDLNWKLNCGQCGSPVVLDK